MPKASAVSKKDFFIGYLYISPFSNEGIYTGAVMITDFRGIPVDFNYVEPIKPTRLERVLYGNALEAYLREELILQNLVKSVTKKPEVLICQDSSLVVPARSLVKYPVIAIEQYSGLPLETAGTYERLPDGECFIYQVEEVGPPIKVCFGFSPQQAEVEALLHILKEAAGYMDLLEPFRRIVKALDVIIEEC